MRADDSLPAREVRHNSYFQAFEQRCELAASDTPALVEPSGVRGGLVTHRVLTYRTLLQGVNRAASALAALGLGPGDRVLLMVPPSVELYQAIMAVLKLGAVCLFIDPADGIASLDRSARSMAPKAFLGIPRAHALRLFSRAVREIPLQLSTSSIPFGLARSWESLLEAGTPRWPTAPALPDEPAMISFTSGSSGLPKGVCRSHRDLRSIFAVLCGHPAKKLVGVNLCAFPVLPLDDLSWGRTVLLPHHAPGKLAAARPEALAEQMRQFPPVLISAPPGMVRSLVEHARARRLSFPSVRHIFTGGGMVPIRLVRDARAVLPEAELHILYGSTEAEPVSMIDAHEVLGETAAKSEDGAGMCVGRTAPGTRVAIVEPVDGPLTGVRPIAGTGEIVVAGPHVNRSYYRDEELTRRHKVQDPATGETWHRMGDLGYFDESGRLWLVGRAAHRVVTAAGTLDPGAVEPIFDALPGVRKTALLGVGPAGAASAVLLVQSEAVPEGSGVLERVRAAVRTRGLPIRLVLECGEIPYDSRIGAKLQYGVLAKRYERAIESGLR